jgi:transposase
MKSWCGAVQFFASYERQLDSLSYPKTLSHLFWFDDEQWAKIAPHLPANQPGPERKDDRLVLSGIMHVLKVGCRWVDCPKAYGPHKTNYNRFARCSERGIWPSSAATARTAAESLKAVFESVFRRATLTP